MIKNGLIAILSVFFAITAGFYFYPVRNIPIILLILVTISLFFIIRAAIPFLNNVRYMALGKKVSVYIFFILFPLFFIASVKGEQLHLVDNHFFVVAIVYFGFFLSIIFGLACLIKIMLNINLPNEEIEVAWWYVFLYSLPFLFVSMIFLVAFYPATMTPDSLAQWEEAHLREFSNWHPVVYTWVIMGLSAMWDSPAIVALFQIGLLSLASGFFGYTLERFSVPKKFIWIGLVILAISPVNAIYSITIWKDVVYSSFMFVFSILIFIIVKTGGRELRKVSYILLFVLVSLGVVFFRHNGFPVFVVTMIMTIIMYKSYWKRLIPITLLIIVLHQLATGPLYTKLGVTPSDPQESLSLPTQQIASIITGNGNLTNSQRHYVDSLMAYPLWKEKYTPYNVDSIKFAWDDYNRSVIYEDPQLYASMWSKMVIANPGLATKGLFNQTSLVWQMNEPHDGYTSKFVTNIYNNNKLGLENRVLHPKVTEFARNYLINTERLEEVIWRPAVYTTIALLFIYIAYLRNDWRAWLLIFPIALNTGSVFLAIPAQDFRYLYSNTLFMFLAIFISFMKYQKVRFSNDPL